MFKHHIRTEINKLCMVDEIKNAYHERKFIIQGVF